VAKVKKNLDNYFPPMEKKTYQGQGRNTKFGHKGGGPNGSTPTKKYKKRYRGQGR
jgi:hypothetical protein